MAEHLGTHGTLDTVDVAPLTMLYPASSCTSYPMTASGAVVNALLDSAGPDGTVIFVDYHRPYPMHLLKPVTALVFRLLEPFAKRM